MAKTLFLLDGMALVYRAHFAFMNRPIFASNGTNTSALFGFANSLLDLLSTYNPTHILVALDTDQPTQRHRDYPLYKAQREAIPEDIAFALPHVRRLLDAFQIRALALDGYEADDIIGTIAKQAAPEGFESYMVTPDKDFGQLVNDSTWILKPGRGGDPPEILKVPDVLKKWEIQRPEQVVDVLALMGDTSDNIPGVSGIGPKSAAKLICQFESIENLLAHLGEVQGKLRERLEAQRDMALLSKKLATIDRNVPLTFQFSDFERREPDAASLKALFVEFEFNALGRRVFGEEFKAGRGHTQRQDELGLATESGPSESASDSKVVVEPPAERDGARLKTIRDVPHHYQLVASGPERAELIRKLSAQSAFCFDVETTHLDPKEARLLGIAFCFSSGEAYYVALPEDASSRADVLREFQDVFADDRIEKVGHNLKFDLSVLQCHGLLVHGPLFDTMLAHCLVEPDQRHGMDYLSEVYLGYTPIPIRDLIGDGKSDSCPMEEVAVDRLAEYAAEDADVTWQLRRRLEPLLRDKGQERVFRSVESPLLPVLVDMELEGVKVDAQALAEFGSQLASRIASLQTQVQDLAGQPFNLNSPKQLGEILFNNLGLGGRPKKTRTGQFATDEQTLQSLAGEHPIVPLILEYRAAIKLKSTYADALPAAIHPRTGRIHTTYHQAVTATGRLASQNPNLQNIPIRTELGQEIRKAFVPRNGDYLLLSADYSQIELRIIAAMSQDTCMIEAFRQGQDIHAATAASLHGVALSDVTPEMRRRAKMVNFGIVYGISAFGLAQRLGIPRSDAGALIDAYFRQFPAIKGAMDKTIQSARERGYVETMSGRRRYLRDLQSANATIRAAAERAAINTPIQGSAADMIKLAMVGIHREFMKRRLRTRMLLQVHDELVFDLFRSEELDVRGIVEDQMKTALPLSVPIVVEIGTGANWLEAH